MKSKVLSPLLGLALLANMATPGVAGGDWGDPGITNYSTNVAVPAPIPVPMYHPMWYFRADVGGGFGDSVSANESGMVFGEGPSGLNGYFPTTPFGMPDSWLSANYSKNVVWNLGIGYYWTRKFRTDITMESRRDLEVHIEGAQSTELSSTVVGGPHVPGDTYNVNTRDHTLVRGAVFMMNGYYEFGEWGPLKPYLGGGVGFGYTDVERTHNTEVVADEAGSGGGSTVLDGYSGRDRQQVTSVALAATVGFTYDLTDITQIDLAYRFLWVDGVHADLHNLGSTVVIDDTTEHQIRAGFRFNVY